MDKQFLNYSLHQGLVEDIKDPLLNGRVKVRVFIYDGTIEDELKTTEQLRWSKVLEPFAGYNKKDKFGYGTFFRPRKGDTVWVLCEAGDSLQRVVIGSTYRYLNDGSPTTPFSFRSIPPFSEDETDPKTPIEAGLEPELELPYVDDSGEPNQYQIKTPGGHIISINESNDKPQVQIRSNLGHSLTFSDEKDNEFILLQDSHRNYIYFDTDKDDLHVYTANNIKVTAGNDFRLVVLNNFDLKVKGYWHAVVDTMITFQSAAMNIMNAATTAIVGKWTWTGGTHTRQGKTNDIGGSSHS